MIRLEKELTPGLKSEAKTVVSENNTAVALGSGSIEVFATPAMIALMENAARSLVQPFLPAGQTTVGTRVEAAHLSATPIGMEVVAKAELLGVEGRKLTFRIEAYDAKEKIGEGIHERFIIIEERFMSKANSK